MSGHSPSVAQSEVDEFVSIDVGDDRTMGLFKCQGKAARPFVHPGHWDFREQVLRTLVHGE